MAHESPRTRLNASALVRVLTELAGTGGNGSKQPFAERLGQWLSLADALSLYSALNASTAGAPAVPAASPSPECKHLRRTFEHLRGALTNAIRADAALEAGSAQGAPASRTSGTSAEGAADFAPWQRRYAAHQRDMGAKIAPFRTTVRAALAARSPALRRLAALDAVLDQALAARERELLATVPTLLQRRFEQLREAHRATQAVADTAAAPRMPAEPHVPTVSATPATSPTAGERCRPLPPGASLAAFGAQMQAVLLAELELRLQPVAGLIAALENEETSKQ